MSSKNKEPIDLMPLAYIAFWMGLFGCIALTIWTNNG